MNPGRPGFFSFHTFSLQWIHSYVTGNKIYCIYNAENEELIRQHAAKGGFPANKISEVFNIISPATATE